jgi:hypothetical protein
LGGGEYREQEVLEAGDDKLYSYLKAGLVDGDGKESYKSCS